MNIKKNKSVKFTKKLKPTNELCVEFSEEELEKLGLSQGDKLSVYPQEDGSILFEKYATMELDTAEWPREILEHLIKMSCEQDISVNDVINDLLLQFIELNQLDSEDSIDEEEYYEDEEQDDDEEFQEGLAFLPMSVYNRVNAIVSEYESQKNNGKEPSVESLAQFLTIAYGCKFPVNQVKAVIEMSNEGDVSQGGLRVNFHQRIQNIIFTHDELEKQYGRKPTVWEVTDALNETDENVKRHQVSAILEINEIPAKKECKPSCCSKSC